MRKVTIDEHGNIVRFDVAELDVNRAREESTPAPVSAPESEQIKTEKETVTMSTFEEEQTMEETTPVSERTFQLDEVEEQVFGGSESLPEEPATEPVADKAATEEPVAEPLVEEQVAVKEISFQQDKETAAKLISLAGARAKEGIIAFDRSGYKPVKLPGGVTVLNVRNFKDQMLVVFAVNGNAGALLYSSTSGRVRDANQYMRIEGDFVMYKDEVVAFKSKLEEYL